MFIQVDKDKHVNVHHIISFEEIYARAYNEDTKNYEFENCVAGMFYVCEGERDTEKEHTRALFLTLTND